MMKYAVCINNQDYPVSLEVRKIYQLLPDDQANTHQMIRVIDESGEDYLYLCPSNYFMAIELSEPLQQAFAAAPM